MYHEVLADRADVESWTVVRESEFRRQMEYLSHNFKVTSLNKALEIMRSTSDSGDPLAVVTFDDGYSGNRRVMLPIIETLRIPVTVYVATEAIMTQGLYWYDHVIVALQPKRGRSITVDLSQFNLGSYHFADRLEGETRWKEIQRVLSDLKQMSPDVRAKAVEHILIEVKTPQGTIGQWLRPLTMGELRDMAESPLVTIGAHSHQHEILVHLDRESIREDIATSKRLLEMWTGRPVEHLAYPNGDFNDDVVAVAPKEGFSCGMTVTGRPWKSSDSVFAIPRIGIGRYDSFDLFKAKVSGFFFQSSAK